MAMIAPRKQDRQKAGSMNQDDGIGTGQIGDIPKLPVFLDLAGRTALLAGGSAGVAWKAELIAAAGANVRVLAPEPCEALLRLAATRSSVTLEQREWQASDLAGASIAVADLESLRAAEAFKAAGTAAGAIVNTIDKGATCDFYFGAIVSRAPILVGITTDGTAPILGQTLRRLVELALPSWLGDWADHARAIRPEVKRRLRPGPQRRRFWEAFSGLALAGPRTTGAEQTLHALLTTDPAPAGEPGTVVTLFAPADADDLSLRDIKRLQAADIILHDPDLPAGIASFFRREATRLRLTDSRRPGDISPGEMPGMLARAGGKSVVVLRRNQTPAGAPDPAQ